MPYQLEESKPQTLAADDLAKNLYYCHREHSSQFLSLPDEEDFNVRITEESQQCRVAPSPCLNLSKSHQALKLQQLEQLCMRPGPRGGMVASLAESASMPGLPMNRNETASSKNDNVYAPCGQNMQGMVAPEAALSQPLKNLTMATLALSAMKLAGI